MNVSIERSGCISCGLCISMCPEVFKFGDDGLSEVIRQPEGAEEAAVKEAAAGCPTSVIYVD